MAKGIKRLLQRVRARVAQTIENDRVESRRYSRALSGEGYNAGYRDALDDMQLALNGVAPRRRR